MTSLITGANGFIGRRLVQPGDRGLMRNLTALPSSVRGDLLDFSSLASACEGTETIFHCAGYAHTFSSSDPDVHWRINYEGTRNLLAAAGHAGVRRFIFLSSVKAMAEPGDVCADGRPIIGMLDGERADVIKRAGAGFVCPAGDSAALAETVQRFAETSLEDRRQMGKQGQAYAKAEFDRNTLVTRLLALLEESISLHRLKQIRKAQR